MMVELNRKFVKYGVVFEQCNVTNVIVNDALFEAMTEKTKIKTELKLHEKDQEYKKLQLENKEQ